MATKRVTLTGWLSTLPLAVRMSARLKRKLRGNKSADHVREFGNCIGIVQGLTNYGKQRGPEVDVRWQPSNLRYAYHPDDLEIA